ncbi:MAG: PilZ domain-containing protein [Candidatus Omnitrophica bacterium]|nr:PilZ domain-containing protein [Candidatus Omnitrophota bacterium]MCA9414982.1 PilZ domain-containing protein [Candidatus Omnitrophota bacterium]MCA9423544.1 PilZ domain-containing protein [Candidatus Omnitrophota bacterium]MCA9428920.1 PilZ domain-containing protein [Candidatus Omnitrophota bacterium]MCA9435068.1 PilZ domain-containing protein [Candidatus Omnitrophota bacterium]
MLFKVGGRVKTEIFLKDPPVVFHTTVKACDNDAIILTAPLVRGKRIGVADSTRVVVTEASATGLLIVDTSVIRMENEPNLAWVLKVPSLQNIRKIQRRREARYEVDLHVRWKSSKVTSEDKLLHLINVNSLGALVSTDVPLEIDDQVVVDLTPLVKVSGKMMDQKLNIVGHVVRRVGNQGSVYGVQFEPMERMNKGRLLEALRRLKTTTI